MKSSALHICFVLLAALPLCECRDGADKETTDRATDESRARFIGEPRDYFPVQAGTKWTYDITIGEIEPVSYRETVWPIGRKGLVNITTGFFPEARERGDRPFRLVLRVKSKAEREGSMKIPGGVELEILEDELNFFRDVKQIYYAVSSGSSGRYMASLVMMFDANSAGAPSDESGDRNREDGYAVRAVYFGPKHGVQIGFGDEPRDLLTFVGPETPGRTDARTPMLHFVRTVKQPTGDHAKSELTDFFTEETWFEKGKGLVLLRQSRHGETSMTWTLRSITGN